MAPSTHTMPRTLTLPSYAKLNYTLDVLSRRDDGYHSIASVLQTVSLADTVTLEQTDEPGVRLECDAAGVPRDHTNLAHRAASAVLAEAGSRDGMRIRLAKRIPAQAGLGGGSSNAAAVLRGTAALLGLALTADRLGALAHDLGSDVPFFLHGGTAAVRGRGEVVTPLPDGPRLWFVIVKPAADVSTAWAYSALDGLPARVSARATRSMEETLTAGEPDRVVTRMANDFEQVVCRSGSPAGLALDDLLMLRARTAHLCGSGSAVFGVMGSEAEAQAAAGSLARRHQSVFVCRSVGRHEALALGPVDEGPA